MATLQTVCERSYVILNVAGTIAVTIIYCLGYKTIFSTVSVVYHWPLKVWLQTVNCKIYSSAIVPYVFLSTYFVFDIVDLDLCIW